MSLNMLIESGDAFDYSGADFRKWRGEVGSKRFEVIHRLPVQRSGGLQMKNSSNNPTPFPT